MCVHVWVCRVRLCACVSVYMDTAPATGRAHHGDACVRARTQACTHVCAWMHACVAVCMASTRHAQSSLITRQGVACMLEHMHTCVHVCLRLDACMRESRAPSLGRAHHLGQGRLATR